MAAKALAPGRERRGRAVVAAALNASAATPLFHHLAAVPRDTLQERAYSAIRTAIEEGQFAPGDEVNITELAAQLEISATPVREALKRLHAEQALEVLPSRLMAVPLLDRKRLAEIRDLRMMIEGFVTEHAAAAATARDCDRLDELHRKMLADDSPAGYLRHNRAFHFAIYDLAPLPMARRLIDLLWLQSGPALARLMARAMAEAGLKAPFDEQHRRIVAALRRRDAKAAAAAIRADIQRAAKFLLELA